MLIVLPPLLVLVPPPPALLLLLLLLLLPQAASANTAPDSRHPAITYLPRAAMAAPPIARPMHGFGWQERRINKLLPGAPARRQRLAGDVH